MRCFKRSIIVSTSLASAAPPRGLSIGLSALLVVGAMLPATIVIPVVRSFVAAHWPQQEWVMHAFLAVNLLGAVVGGPVVAVRAERAGRRRLVAGVAAALDGLTLIAITMSPAVGVLLGLRFFQGAVYIASVSILMGTIRRQSNAPALMGVVGGAVVFAIFVGIPLGAILSKSNPSLPLWVGGGVGILTGLASLRALPASTDAQTSQVTFRALLFDVPLLRAPTAVVALERFAVGALIVPLQLYGHHVLQVPDSRVNAWFSVFLAVFSLSTWPMARLGERWPRWKLVAGGALVYAASYLALGWVSSLAIFGVMALGGLSSAAIYGPCLGLVSQAVPDTARASAMAVVNAAGTLGMFLGSAFAGSLSGSLLAQDIPRATAYTAVFMCAGVLQLVSALVALRARPSTR